MTDIEKAIDLLNAEDCSVVLCFGVVTIKKQGRGISPLVELIDSKAGLSGFSAADKIVGKAAAMLFSHMGITAVYGEVMSQTAYEFLRSRGIDTRYGSLEQNIINRQGDGICPMEQTVFDIFDEHEALSALKQKMAELRSEQKRG